MIVRSRGGAIQCRDNSSLPQLTGTSISPSLDRSNLTAGMPVNAESIRGIPAVTAAARIASEAIASLTLCTYRGEDVDRTKMPNTWQAKLFANPNDQQNPYEWRQTIQESMEFRGNAYLWKLKDPRTGRVVALYALHPDQIRAFFPRDPAINGHIQYYVGVMPGFTDPLDAGYAFYRVGAETILHIRAFGDGGMILAPSFVDVFKQSLGIGLAKLNHEAALYSRGTASRVAISFPNNMRQDQADEWREAWQDAYAGPNNSAKTPVLGGGAVIHPIGLSMVDAQFIQSMAFDVDQVGRMMNVLSSLIGGGVTGRTSANPLTPEHEQDRWLRYGIQPRMLRIENALFSERDLFPLGSPLYPMFDSQRFVRGDLQTEAAIALTKVQSGQWTVNESRARDGLGPLPGGDIPQMTPVGGAPNPESVQVDNTKE